MWLATHFHNRKPGSDTSFQLPATAEKGGSGDGFSGDGFFDGRAGLSPQLTDSAIVDLKEVKYCMGTLVALLK